jgi:hypothetical protein
MNSNDAECRRAFYRFLEELRLEVFSMYEGLREVRTASDDDMEARMQRLGDVGAAASHVHVQIEELFAAVWFGMAAEGDATAAPAMRIERDREPAVVG